MHDRPTRYAELWSLCGVIREVSLRTLITYRKEEENTFETSLPLSHLAASGRMTLNLKTILIFLSAFMVGTTLSAAPLAAQ